MTGEQFAKLEAIKKEFEIACETFSSQGTSDQNCRFEIYENAENGNVLTFSRTIDKFDDSFAGNHYNEVYTLVTPEGELISLPSPVNDKQTETIIAAMKKIA